MKKVDFEKLILFENEDYLVINKPPYLSSLDDRHEAQNILDLAKAQPILNCAIDWIRKPQDVW
jgi:23S rRNA pseudouridine955/2504/2580 synthase